MDLSDFDMVTSSSMIIKLYGLIVNVPQILAVWRFTESVGGGPFQAPTTFGPHILWKRSCLPASVKLMWEKRQEEILAPRKIK